MAKKHLKDSLAEYMIQIIAAQAEKESRKLLKHICAIYRVDAAGNPEQFGTGVFLNVGDSYFLVTVALLGIAQRSVQANYTANVGNKKHAKVLKLNIKTVGDWLKVKRWEKNLNRSHVAAKMGIATSLVSSWESSNREPDGLQSKILATVLDFDTKDFEAIASTTNLP